MQNELVIEIVNVVFKNIVNKIKEIQFKVY